MNGEFVPVNLFEVTAKRCGQCESQRVIICNGYYHANSKEHAIEMLKSDESKKVYFDKFEGCKIYFEVDRKQ